MALIPTKDRYGAVAIFLHWSMAIIIIAMFFLGEYMVELNYAHPWYHRAPHLHESFGLILFALLLIRTVWTATTTKPEPVPMPVWEQRAASIVKRLFYLLLFGIAISGYLIPTADGKSIALFNWFEVPAIISGIEHQEDIAGEVHSVVTHIIMALVALHILAALKHHFIDRDSTLLRMLGIKPNNSRKEKV
ncbi:MAG: cytochrome b [Thermodesulfobacteriota bacterium]